MIKRSDIRSWNTTRYDEVVTRQFPKNLPATNASINPVAAKHVRFVNPGGPQLGLNALFYRVFASRKNFRKSFPLVELLY